MLKEEMRNLRAAHAMVANDYPVRVGIKFLHALGYGSHGNMQRAGDSTVFELPKLTHIQQSRWIGLLYAIRQRLWRNFWELRQRDAS